MRPHLTCNFLFIFALLGASCSSPSLPSEESIAHFNQSIMGGEDDLDHPAVVGVINLQDFGICTGTLVAPNLVLTARHCVSETEEAVFCATSEFGALTATSTLLVTTSAEMTDMQSGWYSVEEVIVPENPKVCGNDMALIRLVGAGVPSSVTLPILPRVDDDVVIGEVYSALGYGGVNDQGSQAGRRRIREGLSVDCVGNCPGLVVSNETEWRGQTGVCVGDSGGPALDEQGRVIGVVSRGMANCSSPVYGSVFKWRDWLREHALQAAQQGGYEPAPWVLGNEPELDAGVGEASVEQDTGPTGALLKEPCDNHVDCQSGVCVYENDLTRYCSSLCSASNPSCPDGFVCDAAIGACFLPGGYGATCAVGKECRSLVCVEDRNGAYCSQHCTSDSECPDLSTCDAQLGVCFLPSKKSKGSGIKASKGCSISSSEADDTRLPWMSFAGTAALALMVRSRRRVS